MEAMFQQINLFHPPQEAPPPKLSFILMLQVWGGIAALLIIIWYTLSIMSWFQARSLAHAKIEVEQVRAELIEKSKALDMVSDESQINAELEELQVKLDAKFKTIQTLQKNGLGNTKGFSQYLEALGNSHVDNTWLTRIKLIYGGMKVDLEGKASMPDLVPRMLTELSMEKAFDGTPFHSLNITRESDTTVSFDIETEVGAKQ